MGKPFNIVAIVCTLLLHETTPPCVEFFRGGHDSRTMTRQKLDGAPPLHAQLQAIIHKDLKN